MNILDMILEAQNGGAVSEVAKNFGIEERQARDVFAEVVPPFARGMQRNTQKQGGLDDLIGALTRGKHDSYLDDLSSLSNPSTTKDGNDILGHVFGSKEVSRNVAKHAGTKTGIDSSLIKKILPIVAAIAMGVLSKKGRSTGMPTGLPTGSGGGGLGDILSSVLDSDKDGSMLDDLIGMAGKMMR